MITPDTTFLYAVDVMHEPDALLLIILAVCVDHIIEDPKGEHAR